MAAAPGVPDIDGCHLEVFGTSSETVDGYRHHGFGCIVDLFGYDCPTVVCFTTLTHSDYPGRVYARGAYLTTAWVDREGDEQDPDLDSMQNTLDRYWYMYPPMDLTEIGKHQGHYLYKELTAEAFWDIYDTVARGIRDGYDKYAIFKTYMGSNAYAVTMVLTEADENRVQEHLQNRERRHPEERSHRGQRHRRDEDEVEENVEDEDVEDEDMEGGEQRPRGQGRASKRSRFH